MIRKPTRITSPIVVLYTLFIGITALLYGNLTACQNAPSQQATTIVLPTTPEGVCHAWQSFLDKNEVAKAALLGTPKTKTWLKENQDLFLADEVFEPTQFITMSCQETEEQAICKYTIAEEGYMIEDFFTLLRINGQWLIHIEETASNDPNEKAFEEMKKMLDLQ